MYSVMQVNRELMNVIESLQKEEEALEAKDIEDDADSESDDESNKDKTTQDNIPAENDESVG